MAEIDFLELARTFEDARRHIIIKTVEQYPLAWRVIHEAVQNSIDAITRSNSDAPGTIDIVFDLTDQSVEVRDNGIGFPHEIKLLGFGGSDKDDSFENQKGCMGVGLKVVMLSSTEFYLESVTSNKHWWARQENGYRFADGTEGKIEYADEEAETSEENGTFLRYRFQDREVSEFLDEVWQAWQRHELIDQALDRIAPDTVTKLKLLLEWHFRTASYAAYLDPIFGLDDTKIPTISVELKYNDGSLEHFPSETKNALQQVSSFVIEFPAQYWDFETAIARIPRNRRRPEAYPVDLIPEAGYLPVPLNENYIFVATLANQEAYRSLLVNPNVRRQVEQSKYDSLVDKINGIYILVGSVPTLRQVIFSSASQRIFARGVPTMHDIRHPIKSSEIGRLSQIHFLISLDQELNYGKQMISNTRLVGMVNDFFEDAYRMTLKNIAKHLVGSSEERGSALIDEDYLDKDIVDREDLGIPDLRIRKAPKDENAVIALFFELLGRGDLEGFNIYSLHGRDTYDCRAVIKKSSDRSLRKPRNDSRLEIIEFKLHLSGIVDNFEEVDNKKDPREIHLLVVWDIDFDERIGYQVIDIEETPDSDNYYPRVYKSLLVRREGQYIQVLELKQVIEEMRANLTSST